MEIETRWGIATNMEETIRAFLSRFEADERQLLVVSLADTPITAEHFTLVIGDETVVFDVDNARNFVGTRSLTHLLTYSLTHLLNNLITYSYSYS
jgi:hypothetical protein